MYPEVLRFTLIFFIFPGRQFALLGASLTTSGSSRRLESLDVLGVRHLTVSAADGNGAHRSIVSGSVDVGRRTDGFGNPQSTKTSVGLLCRNSPHMQP